MRLQSLGVKSIVFAEKTISFTDGEIATVNLAASNSLKETAYLDAVTTKNGGALANLAVHIDGTNIQLYYGTSKAPTGEWWL